MLREDGHVVRALAAAVDLPQLATLADVGVLLAAHEMPAQNGLWMADRFHRAYPAVPIVLLTAYCPASLHRELAVRPFIRLVEKPVGYPELHSLIHTLAD